MAVLVTGGAGYIGSHTVAELCKLGEEVIVVDSLELGHMAAVNDARMYIGDIRDQALLSRIFNENTIDAVIHFAAYSLVGESMKNPGKYYHNNVHGTQCLLEAMTAQQVKHIVFSSTAATYGEPERIPIVESDRTKPTNAYGATKLAMEQMMGWYKQAYGLSYVALRYFNAAGAHESGSIGEDHAPETHLIPLILEVALGKRKQIAVYGNDYPTADGTCIRDYLHVTDLAQAHILALQKLRAGGESSIYNLGNGTGFSVLEVIEAVRKVTGHPIPAVMEARRPGDPAVLIASSEKIKQELGWNPQMDDIEKIIESAWQWHRNHPNGYGEH